jgi:predicted Zn-dependent protease
MNTNDITQKEFERIEAYLNNALSEEKLLVFEEQLKRDKEFAATVESIKMTIAGIETQALKEQLNDFHDELTTPEKDTKSKEPKVRTLHWKRIAVAAVLIIAAGSLWFINSDSNQMLYNEFYTPDPGLPTTMNSSNQYEFYNAMVSYKRGRYTDALKTWNSQLKLKAENDTLNYFVGSALMANKEEKKAIPYFKDVTTQKNSVFRNEAFYYLGLAYLKDGQTDQAREFLQQSDLVKAKALLKKMK